ncbi:MAG: UbiA prenyltransferase family protein [Deltaproteobacteria bacterium]|nr:UbiA prenyltransferase family protein [Deltaproteobacteria bacterium]
MPEVLPALGAILAACVPGHAVNYVADVRVDALATRVKDRDPRLNPVLTGEVSRRGAYALSLLGTCLALALAWAAGPACFSAIAVMIAGGVVGYSMLYMKSRPLLDLVLPLSTGPPLFAAGFCLGGAPVPALHVLVFSILAISAFLDTVIHDVDFDRRAGLRTTAVWLGERRARGLELELMAIGGGLSALALTLTGDPFFAFTLAACSLRFIIGKMMKRLYVFAVLSIGYVGHSLLAALL